MAGSSSSFSRIHELPKSNSLCADFLYFQQMLARSRSYHDDNIAQRLNTINTEDPLQCRQFWETLGHLHQDRREKLHFCMDLLKERLAVDKDSMVLRKEVHGVWCESSVSPLFTGRRS